MSDIIKLLDKSLKKHEVFEALNACDEVKLNKLLKKNYWSDEDFNSFCASCITNLSNHPKFKEITILCLSKINNVDGYLFEYFFNNDSRDLLEMVIKKPICFSDVNFYNIACMLNRNEISNFDLLLSVINQDHATMTLSELLKNEFKSYHTVHNMSAINLNLLLKKADVLKSFKIVSEMNEESIISETCLLNQVAKKIYNQSFAGLSNHEFYPNLEKRVILQSMNLNELKKNIYKI